MTVAELITALQAMPQDGVVVIRDDHYGWGEVDEIEATADPMHNPTFDGMTIAIYTGPA